MTLARYARIAVTFDQFKPKLNEAGEAVETYCNQFIISCANEVGCPEFNGMSANAISLKCASSPSFLSIDAAEAQQMANNGHFVLATWYNPSGHGHVCLVVPGMIGWSKQYGCDMPMIANVGVTNFYGRIASYAFGPDRIPKYYAWKGEIK